MSKNSKQSEDVLFMVKHVRHKKVDGTLYVNSGRIAWRNQTSDSFRISAAFEDIRMQRVSLDSREKVQLQLLMHSGESFTFHFADPAGQKRQIEARNKVKEVLQQMLPKFKDKAHVELNEKFCILESNPHLLALYKELVVTGILSSEEFWARPEFSQAKSIGSVESVASSVSKDEYVPPQWVSSKGISLSLVPELPQVAGVSSCLLSDIKPEMDGANSIRYNLTKDSIDAIFRAYPAVRQRHKELVPDKLTEPEFWNKFFQSHYYHRDRAVMNKDDIFNDCDEVDEKMLHTEFLRCKRMRAVSHLDFDSLEDHSIGEGYGLDLPEQSQLSSSHTKQKGNTNQLLIHRFNKHSNLILRSQAKHTAMTAPTKPAMDSTYRDLASSGTLKRKLTVPAAAIEDPDKKPRESITLSVTKDYFQNPITFNQASPISQALSQSQARQALAACQASLGMSNGGNRPTLNYTDVQSAIADVSAGGCLTTGGKTASGEKTAGTPSSVLMLLSAEQSKELSMLISAAGELLRHFWVCLPTTSIAMAEKIIRIHDSLLRFETNKLIPFIESIESTLSNAGVRGGSGLNGSYRCQVTAHLESLINAAKSMFRGWKLGQQRAARSQ
nr:general transcription factor iih subunit 1 [Hymenolepis microstoma]